VRHWHQAAARHPPATDRRLCAVAGSARFALGVPAARHDRVRHGLSRLRFGRWRGGGDLEHRLGRRGGTVYGGEDLLEAARAVTGGVVGEQVPRGGRHRRRPGGFLCDQAGRALVLREGDVGVLLISTDQADARVRRLSTTATSTSYWRDRSAADQQQVLDWFGDLTPAEAQTLFDLLAKVEHRARAALGRPQQDRTQGRGPGPGPGPA
jgi:hypothetical protein